MQQDSYSDKIRIGMSALNWRLQGPTQWTRQCTSPRAEVKSSSSTWLLGLISWNCCLSFATHIPFPLTGLDAPHEQVFHASSVSRLHDAMNAIETQ